MSGKHLHSAQKTMVLSVRDFFKREKELGSPVQFDNVAKRTAMAVNLSESTVKVSTAGQG